MLKKLVLAATCSVALLGNAYAATKNFTPNIAVVNLQLIMFEIPQAKAVQATMEKTFGSRQKELMDLDAKGKKLYNELQSGVYQGDKAVDARRRLAALESDIQLKSQALREDSRKKLQEEQNKVLTLVQKEINAVAKDRGIDIILQKEAIGYLSEEADKNINITQAVIDRLVKDNKK